MKIFWCYSLWTAAFFTVLVIYPTGFAFCKTNSTIQTSLSPAIFVQPVLPLEEAIPLGINPTWTWHLKWRQGLLFRHITENIPLYYESEIPDNAQLSSIFSQLSFEARHRSNLGFELGAGLDRIFYSNLFKDDVKKYFLTAFARVNWHFFSDDQRIDLYSTSGAFFNKNRDNTEWNAIFGFGLSYSFCRDHLNPFTELAFSGNFNGNTATHLVFGIDYRF